MSVPFKAPTLQTTSLAGGELKMIVKSTLELEEAMTVEGSINSTVGGLRTLNSRGSEMSTEPTDKAKLAFS